jgi:hypothetical protein
MKVDTILNVGIIVLGIILIISLFITSKSDCDACKFKLSGKTINFKTFIGLYQDNCLPQTTYIGMYKQPTLNLSNPSNQS